MVRNHRADLRMVNHHLVILYPQHPSYTSSWHTLWTKKWRPFEIPPDNLQSTAYIQLMCVRQNGEWNMVQSVLYTARRNRKAVYPGVIWVTARPQAMSTLGLRYWLLIAVLQKWWYTIYHGMAQWHWYPPPRMSIWGCLSPAATSTHYNFLITRFPPQLHNPS